MKKILNNVLCAVLAAAMIFSFSSCSKANSMTEENIKNTVATVETALKEFDTDTLNKYVSSTTLDYIIKFSSSHEQFAQLGKAIFANLEMEVKSVDLQNQTVTITVSNSKLTEIATIFTEGLKA